MGPSCWQGPDKLNSLVSLLCESSLFPKKNARVSIKRIVETFLSVRISPN